MWLATPSRVRPKPTKSEFGSSTTMRRLVSCRICSSITPSEYVFPEPDCPHRNVWRSNPPASRANRTPGASRSSPTSSWARGGRARSSQAATSSGLAVRISPSWNGLAAPSRITPVPRTARIRTVVESCASDSLPPADSISGPSASTRARSRIWPMPRRLTVVDHDISTGANVESMRRQLAREVTPVDRRRERQHRLLEPTAQASESLAVLVEQVGRLAQDTTSLLTT